MPLSVSALVAVQNETRGAEAASETHRDTERERDRDGGGD